LAKPRSTASLKKARRWSLQAAIRLDIAFANAGTEIGDADIETVELEAWNNLIGINLTGAMLTAQMAVNLMKDNPDGPTGSIIINSSMNGHWPLGNYVTYSTAKGAHIALGKSTAVRRRGLRCSSRAI